MLTPAFWGSAAVVAVLSYLLGSLNFAIILSRGVAKEDVRNHGSGNAGMTNMLRTFGKRSAALTAAGDFFKALIAVFLSRAVFRGMGILFIDAGYISGLFVLLGHLFPVYFGFKGGKGVMTTLGIMLAVYPMVFLVIAVLFVPVVLITKIVSLGSVLGALAFPILTYFSAVLRNRHVLYETIFACVFTIVIIFTHRDNIKRLLNGTENKFGGKPKE